MATTVLFSEDYLRADKGSKVLATIIAFSILAFITVSLRLYTRFHIVHNPSWEDLAIFLALVRFTYPLKEIFSYLLFHAGVWYCDINMSRFPWVARRSSL